MKIIIVIKKLIIIRFKIITNYKQKLSIYKKNGFVERSKILAGYRSEKYFVELK